MKNIYYKSSEGVVINLIEKPYMMLSETDLLNWEWQYETVGTNYPYISAFKNQMVSKAISVRVSGATEDVFYNNLEHLIEVVDRDVRLNQAGRLYCGDYFIECFITGTTKAKVFRKTYTTLGLTILAENGDWKSIQDQSYSGVSGGKYINKYCVPSVSSNENDYEYGVVEDTQGTFTFTADYSQGFDVSYYTTFTFESVSANVQYRFFPNEAYTTVTPSDCPLEIDVSNKDKIEVKPSTFCTISYSMTVEPNASFISWQTSEYDEVREFVLDLGDVTSIESITGIKVANLVGETHIASMMLSQDNINWSTAETVTMSGTSDYSLDHTPSTPIDIRYIKITSDGLFKVSSRTFKIEAHFTGEEQNLATSVVVSNEGLRSYNYEITEQGLVETSFNIDTYASVGIFVGLVLTLPEPTTIVAINNLSIKNKGTNATNFYIKNQSDNTIDSATVQPNETINYSWSGEEEVEQVKLGVFGIAHFEVTSSNFEILEEQTEAPHRYILNENYVPSDVIIKINGPTTSPSIMIGDNQYGAENITLDDGEYLEINTQDETIQHYVDSEGWVNVFNHRLDDTFEKIEVGTSEITWQGNLDIDIRLLNSRSDPKWN